MVDLASEVKTLGQQIEVLRVAIDDCRQEVEFALRQWQRHEWAPTQPTGGIHDAAACHSQNVAQAAPVPPPAASATLLKSAPTETPDTASPKPIQKRSSPKAQRLDLKLYFQSVYADLVRFIGYGGRPLAEVQAFVRDLEKKHGREKVKEASHDVVVIEGRGERYAVRLRDEVRKLAMQMLGPPSDVNLPVSHGT